MDDRSLHTDRLRLEPWGGEHAEMLVALSAMPEVMRHIGPGVTWTSARARARAAEAERHWEVHGFGWRAAIDRSTGVAVGFIGLNHVGEGTIGLDPGEHEIGWWLDPDVWGRGLAREGAAAVRDEALGRVGAPSLIARVQPANAASVAVAEAVGLRFDVTTTGRWGEPVAVYRLTDPHRTTDGDCG
jgi:RimJ/RimL family protein N-acetyltransferase